jgi:hypothetical protein
VWASLSHPISSSIRPLVLRVRVEIMGSQKCRTVGESQSVLIMIDPIISTCTRTTMPLVLRSAPCLRRSI